MASKVLIAVLGDLSEICIFMRLKYKLCQPWSDDFLRSWVRWYVDQGFCAIARESIPVYDKRIVFGHIQALLLGRPIKDIQDVFNETYAVDREGDIYFIDIVIMDDNRLGWFLKDAMVESVGMKNYIAFTRDHGKMERVRKYPIHKLLHYYEPHLRR